MNGAYCVDGRAGADEHGARDGAYDVDAAYEGACCAADVMCDAALWDDDVGACADYDGGYSGVCCAARDGVATAGGAYRGGVAAVAGADDVSEVVGGIVCVADCCADGCVMDRARASRLLLVLQMRMALLLVT